MIQDKEEMIEYLISEIVFSPIDKNNPEPEITEILNKIKIEGFENVAMSFSISETATRGGDLGWVSENVISEEYKSKISKTAVGEVSAPIFLPAGVLIFKVRDIKKNKKEHRGRKK